MKKVFLFIAAPLLIVTGCHNSIYTNIKVDNRLNKKIICVLGYTYPNLNIDFINKKSTLADSNLFEVDSGQIKEIDTVGLCIKSNWDKHVHPSLIILFVFDKTKFIHSKNLEDALIERYYFSYTQILKNKGVITVN